MVEKKGEKFELRSKLFDHAARNGSNYLNGHCMISVLLSSPVMSDGFIRYLSVPLGYQIWSKEQTKLEIAIEMVRHAMETIGADRLVPLLCDNWYPKECVANLVDEFHNLDIICKAQDNAVVQGNMANACHQMILSLNSKNQRLADWSAPLRLSENYF